MFTISNILMDIDRGILAHNMIETCFSYRIVYFVNENNKGTKFCADTSYDGLRTVLEHIIRNNLSPTNTVVIAQTTAVKNGKCVCLQNRSYAFSLDEFFRQVSGECRNASRNAVALYDSYPARHINRKGNLYG